MSVLVAVRPEAEAERARGVVRLRPVPPTDPPFDDELGDRIGSGATGQAQLPLDWGPPGPAAPRTTPPAAPVTTRATTSPAPATTRPTPLATDRGSGRPAAGESAIAVHQFVKMCVEVLNGFRPPGQLRLMAVPDLREHLIRQLAPRPARRRDVRPGGQVTLGQVRVCEPRPGAGEAAVVLHQAGAVWAMALRLELRDGCWLCTAAETI